MTSGNRSSKMAARAQGFVETAPVVAAEPAEVLRAPMYENVNLGRMQRQQVEKLKRDNERLKEDLALETRQAKQANNMSASAQIAKLQDQGDLYARKIAREKERVKRLKEQLTIVQEQMLTQRKAMGGVNAFKANNQAVQKQIRILENRLDKVRVFRAACL